MIGLGTIINTLAVIAGGLIGMCLKKWFEEELSGYLDAGLRSGNYFYWSIGNFSQNVCDRKEKISDC